MMEKAKAKVKNGKKKKKVKKEMGKVGVSRLADSHGVTPDEWDPDQGNRGGRIAYRGAGEYPNARKSQLSFSTFPECLLHPGCPLLPEAVGAEPLVVVSRP